MGMTIDESIGWIKKTILDMRRAETCISDRLALETAIDTMRKYQKIQAIINNAKDLDSAIKYNWLYEQISEVVGDGKID